MSQNNRDPRSSSCLKEGDLGRGRGRGQIQGKSHLLVLEEKGREDSEKRVESKPKSPKGRLLSGSQGRMWGPSKQMPSPRTTSFWKFPVGCPEILVCSCLSFPSFPSTQ